MLTKRITNFIRIFGILALAACAIPTPAPTATITPAPTETPTTPPTTPPSATATATPEPTETPTATVVPSRTPRPTSTATPVPQPGDVLLSDTFDNNNNRWAANPFNGVIFAVEDGSLTGEIKEKQIMYWSVQHGPFTNVDMTFEATPLIGSSSNTIYGGVCRFYDSDNFYLFQISNGNYSIQHMDKGQWKAIVDWKASGAIRAGKARNTLRIICTGEMLQFWANGTKLVTVHYPGLKDGGIGLAVGTYNSTDSKVKFDNLVVKFPEPVTLGSGGGGSAGNGTPRPTAPANGQATQAPAATALPNGQGSIQIQNTIDFGVHFVLWGPSNQAFDAPAHQTVTIAVPTGEYGWQVFANNCELHPTSNLIVKPAAIVLVETYTENSCGYQVRWGIP